MNSFPKKLVIFLLAILLCVSSFAGEPVFKAYSLRQAAKRSQNGDTGEELRTLAGITRIAGMVYDRTDKDIILIGLAAPELPTARLDDLVVALRARMNYDQWPLVSIDPAQDTEQTGLQRVRFDGHLEDTAYGKDFLDCDILLKLYSLQKMNAIPSVRPYNIHLEQDITASVEKAGAKFLRIRWLSGDEKKSLSSQCQNMVISNMESYQARFWFYAIEPWLGVNKEDVFCIKELRLGLQSESIFQENTAVPPRAREEFAREWTEHFDEMYREFPTLRKLKTLYDFVAVAEAIRNLEEQSYISYFLKDYQAPLVKTDPSYKLEEIYGIVERSDGLRHLVRVSGGIELRTEIKLLNYGVATQLKPLVLESRPSSESLSWSLPLKGWIMPNARDLDLWNKSEAAPSGFSVSEPQKTPGCSFLSQSIILTPALDTDTNKRFSGFPPFPQPPPPLKGVSMKMAISDDSFEKDKRGQLEQLRNEILESRPSADTLIWPNQEQKEQKDESKK